MYYLKLVAPATILMVSSAPVLAIEWREEIARCAAVVGTAERLACFEALAMISDEDPSTSLPPPIKDRAESADQSAIELPTEEALTSTDRFGRETLPATAKPSEDELDSIDSVLVKLVRRPRGEYLFELANGQVWTEISTGRGQFSEGTPIHIERTTFGGYMLSTARGGATRVRRVE
ncbi:MAG: hypothetical protein KDI31_09105 [Pseudomonadales bacterium]|nr:hypothetical protein [Pseudomonadales bacterium]